MGGCHAGMVPPRRRLGGARVAGSQKVTMGGSRGVSVEHQAPPSAAFFRLPADTPVLKPG